MPPTPDQSGYPPSARALSTAEWKDLRERQMTWHLNNHHQVALEDPTTGRVATGRTLKLAYDQVINN